MEVSVTYYSTFCHKALKLLVMETHENFQQFGESFKTLDHENFQHFS